MPTNTYTPLATTTLAVAAASISFGSIPGNYRDLVLVVRSPSASAIRFTINGDTTSNYILQNFRAESTVSAATATNAFTTATDNIGFSTLQIMDYSVTDKHKTILRRRNTISGDATDLGAIRWGSTAAITTLRFDLASGNLPIGTIISLYGIIA